MDTNPIESAKPIMNRYYARIAEIWGLSAQQLETNALAEIRKLERARSTPNIAWLGEGFIAVCSPMPQGQDDLGKRYRVTEESKVGLVNFVCYCDTKEEAELYRKEHKAE